MLTARQWPDEATCTPERGCRWIAETVVAGVTYTAQSRSGATHELARILVAAGIPDAPIRVETCGIAGHLTHPSFHEAAKWSISDSGERRRWEDPDRRAARFHRASTQKQGEDDPVDPQ